MRDVAMVRVRRVGVPIFLPFLKLTELADLVGRDLGGITNLSKKG